MSRAADARLPRAACIAAALLVAVGAQAQTAPAPQQQQQTRTLYRWTDEQGRIQYSDKPPTKFKGEVTRIEVDLDSNTSPATPAPRAPLVAPDVLRDLTPDVGKQRRDKRARLEQDVRAAEARVANAKAALAAGGDAKDDERNVVQRQFATPQPGKSNCRPVVGDNGKQVIVCPALVPNEQYYERQKALEDAVQKAEEELSAAQEAYRRGVD